MNHFSLFIMLLAVGMLCSHLAKRRGRNPRAWFLLGFLFGLIGLVILWLLPPIRPKLRIPQPSSTPGPTTPLLEIRDPTHTDKLWYYLDDTHTQQGPMSIHALSQAWKEGKVKTKTYVWNENLTNWESLDQVLKPLG